jgi:hypothetical protein
MLFAGRYPLHARSLSAVDPSPFSSPQFRAELGIVSEF